MEKQNEKPEVRGQKKKTGFDEWEIEVSRL